MCMYEWTYVCMSACIYTKSTSMSMYTYSMSLNKYDCHIWNITHTVIMLYGHIESTFLPMCGKRQWTAIYTHMVLPYMGQQQICLPICKIYKLAHVHMSQLCQYKFLIWTHCNQQCDHKHCYTYNSHYSHMPLSKYAFLIAHICPMALWL